MTTDAATALPNLSTLILAIGALGTAAFGLVDAFKALPGGGVSRFGFKFVKEVIERLLPASGEAKRNVLTRDDLIFALRSQWINGAASLADQVNIAKSLIKLRLTPDTAGQMADATGVDKSVMTEVAQNMQKPAALSQAQSDVYGRFDLMLTTLLDQAYQRAEQRYRNAAKLYAVGIAVTLSVITNYSLSAGKIGNITLHPISTWQAVVLGLIATPVAPVAKDLASAIQTASKAIQAFKS